MILKFLQICQLNIFFGLFQKKGVFKFSVIHYKNHISVELKTEYFIAVKIKGEIVYETEGVISKEKQEQFIFMISFDENKNYEIKAIEKKRLK